MKKKNLVIINICLGLVAAILILNLFGLKMPSRGYANYLLDPTEPVCATGFGDQKSLFNTDMCCSEIQKQLKCETLDQTLMIDGEEVRVNKRCYTGPGTIEYYVNNKMYNLCKKEGYLGYSIF